MGIFQHHQRQWSNGQEIVPESDCISSEHSLSSVSSLTSSKDSKQPFQKHQYLTTFKAHTSSITSLTLTGNHLLSGSSDHKVRFWPRDSSKNLVAFGESPVKSMVVSGDKLFTGHQDHKICVWKICQREADNSNSNSSSNRSSCYTSNSYCSNSNWKMTTSTYLATLSTLNDRFTKMFLSKNNIKTSRNKRANHTDAVVALAVSHDGAFLYSGSWDRTFKVWRTSDFKCLESVCDAHDDAINAIVVSEDGYVYTGSSDRKIKVWRKLSGENKHTLIDVLEKHKSALNALALSTDGSVLYSGACDRSILVWTSGNDGRHMVVAGALRGHSKEILSIVVVGDLVVTGSTDKTVRVWRGISGIKYSRVCILEGHNGPVKCLAAALDTCGSDESGGTSYLVYSGSLDCDVKVWKIWVPFL
ncbi:protein JINGUBANG-like [Bidens hawaiensis]|uniref:protein JINGUBANG-like n=1 Tax=Bidens hawaiensis TaxID=980011 RepID=UPI004049E18F